MGCHFEISILYMQHNTLSHLDWNLEWTKMSFTIFHQCAIAKINWKKSKCVSTSKNDWSFSWGQEEEGLACTQKSQGSHVFELVGWFQIL
jgi:hypothetical protein